VSLDGIREAVDADSWALMALIGACWAEYPGCVVDFAGEYPELLAPASHYQAAGGALWVLPEGEWIAASVGLSAGHGRRVELVKLYVARHRRGQGVGRALVGWVEQEARRQGAAEIELWSDSRFHSAHRLYERLGYQRTGTTRELGDRSDTTELFFAKALLAP
jgi:putative acetyltransferase